MARLYHFKEHHHRPTGESRRLWVDLDEVIGVIELKHEKECVLCLKSGKEILVSNYDPEEVVRLIHSRVVE